MLYLWKSYNSWTIQKKTHIPVDDVTLTPQLDIETWPKRKMEPHNHLLEKVKATSNPTIRFEGLKQTNKRTNKQTSNQPNKQTTKQTNKQTTPSISTWLIPSTTPFPNQSPVSTFPNSWSHATDVKPNLHLDAIIFFSIHQLHNLHRIDGGPCDHVASLEWQRHVVILEALERTFLVGTGHFMRYIIRFEGWWIFTRHQLGESTVFFELCPSNEIFLKNPRL